MIDLVMLKDFLVLCRIKSFSRAAQECHVLKMKNCLA